MMDDLYWGGSYWGGSYWADSFWGAALVIVPFDYAEIWDGSVRLMMIVDGNVVLNKEVNAGVIMNQEITDTYSELEAI